MGEDWKDLDVLSSLRSVFPPRYLWADGDHENLWEERNSTIREHYNEIVELLRDGGYERLVAIKDRLESHLSDVEERVEQCRGRVLNSTLQYRAYRQRLLDIADERADEDADVEEVEEIKTSLRDTPIGKPWFVDGGVTANLRGNWNPTLTYAATSSPSLSDVTISYTPTEEALPQFGLHQKYEEYDSDSFRSARTLTFSGDTTWEEAFESLKRQKDAHLERKNRAARTAKLLHFRLSVVETVLYRFETFGSVDRLTEGEAEEIAEESNPGRKSTLNDPETYPAVTLRAVLEWVGDDTNRAKPFRSESQSSLCGFVSERLEEKVGYQVPQDTIKTRLQSLMSDLGVELPHGHTNTRSYFEAREEIAEAMQKHGLSV